MHVYMKLLKFLFLSLILQYSCSAQEDNLLDDIIEQNEVHYSSTGFTGQISDQYIRFAKLSMKNPEELIPLTKHENNTVRCYSTWALIDKNHDGLVDLYADFIGAKDSVTTFSACVKSRDPISEVVYYRYFNSIKQEARELDSILTKMDSMALYSPSTNSHLINRALDNRIYPDSYHSRIEELAFQEGNIDAILYLSQWYKEEYRDPLKIALFKNLNRTDLRFRIGSLYKIAEGALSFEDPSLKERLISILSQHGDWRYVKNRFMPLLHKYGIYELD